MGAPKEQVTSMNCGFGSAARLGRAVCVAFFSFAATPVLAGEVTNPVNFSIVPAFDNQPVLVKGALGVLKVCKVAGPGIAIGTSFGFVANNMPLTVPAGRAPGGTCVVGPSFPVGTTVSVAETVRHGDTVSAITVVPSGRSSGSPNLADGTVDVQIGSGVTEVTFTDKRTGYLEICKTGSVTGDFSFIVNPGSLGPLVVAAGACTPTIEVEAGTVLITEWPSDTTVTVGCSTFPENYQVACDRGARTSTVTVVAGDASTQTIAFIANGPVDGGFGTITVIKAVKNNTRADLTDWQYPISLACDGGLGETRFNLADGQSWAVDGVPAGLDCKLGEAAPAVPEKACPEGLTPQWSSSTSPGSSPDGYVHAGDTITLTNILQCVPKRTDLTVRKTLDGPIPADLSTASFPVTITGCGSDPGTVDITSPIFSQTVAVNVGDTCTVTEGVPTGVTLPVNCEWQTTYLPGAKINILENGKNVLRVSNSVFCDLPKVDLRVGKRLVSKGSLHPGGTAEFDVTVYNNNGPVTAPYTITVTDTLPPGFTFTGGGGGGWICSGTPGGFTCSKTVPAGGPPLASNWYSNLTIQTNIGKNTKGGLQCAIVGIAPQTDVNPSNDKTCIKVLVKSVTTGGGGDGPFVCVAGLRSANSSLNLRSAPTGSAKVLQTLPMGTALTVLGREGKWLRVQVMINGRKGQVGWVASRFTKVVENPNQCKALAPDDTGTTTDTGDSGGGGEPKVTLACVAGLPKGDPILNLRDEPSGGAKILRQLPSGTPLQVLKRRGNWSRVQVVTGGRKGPVGWVATRFTRGPLARSVRADHSTGNTATRAPRTAKGCR